MQNGGALWFTGLSDTGKTTASSLLAGRLRATGNKVELLAGDVLRTNLSRGLGFSRADREENVRRVMHVCELLSRNGVLAIAALTSPYRTGRDEARARISTFVEIYINCPVDILVQRDVKGFYKKALAGEVLNFTGISDPYEPPLNPELTIDSSTETPEESVNRILNRLQELGVIALLHPGI